MAGSYPDAPSRRMAWHEDGTVGWYRYQGGDNWGALGAGVTHMSSSQKINLNNEDDTSILSSQGNSVYWALIFPEPRDTYGVFLDWYGQTEPTLRDVQWSADTTNGISGTWTEFISSRTSPEDSVINRYRTEIDVVSFAAVRSIRGIVYDVSIFDEPSRLMAVHIYGAIASGETPDRILFIDNSTGLEFTSVHDWGDVPRGTTLDKNIKIKNNSASLVASDIDFTFDDLTLSSDAWYTLSDSGGAFSSTLNVAGPIAAGASYPAADVIRIRLTISDAETSLGLQSAYLRAFVNTWT